MKVVGILVTVVNIASVYAFQIAPYKVFQVTNVSAWGPQTRIYGGTEAQDGQFPFMIFALMYTPRGVARCSASLIDENWVLIAAHCVDIYDLLPQNIILVGRKANLLQYVRERLQVPPTQRVDEKRLGVEERRAKEFFIHPGYETTEFHHDIALIRLQQPFTSPDIKIIPLSKEKMTKPSYCTILGWGMTPEDESNFKLNYANSKLVYTMETGCKYKHKEPFLCLKPRDSGLCSGDSGSPLVCDNKVWGVASHLLYETTNKCGESLEEYYSEIHPDLDWINNLYKGGSPSVKVTLTNVFVLSFVWIFLNSYLDVYKI